MGPPFLLRRLRAGDVLFRVFSRRARRRAARHLAERTSTSRSGIASDPDGSGRPYMSSTTPQRRAYDTIRGCERSVSRLRIYNKAELRKLPILVRAFRSSGFVLSRAATATRACRPSSVRQRPCAGANPSTSSFRRHRSRTGEILPSRRAGSSWHCRGRRRFVRWRSRGPGTREEGRRMLASPSITVSVGPPIETAGCRGGSGTR